MAVSFLPLSRGGEMGGDTRLARTTLVHRDRVAPCPPPATPARHTVAPALRANSGCARECWLETGEGLGEPQALCATSEDDRSGGGEQGGLDTPPPRQTTLIRREGGPSESVRSGVCGGDREAAPRARGQAKRGRGHRRTTERRTTERRGAWGRKGRRRRRLRRRTCSTARDRRRWSVPRRAAPGASTSGWAGSSSLRSHLHARGMRRAPQEVRGG